MLSNKPTGRYNMMVELSNMGMMSFFEDSKITKSMTEEFPDSLGMKDEEILALPDLIRNIKCEGKFESGEPYCHEEKYNNYLCYPRKGMAGWHPG